MGRRARIPLVALGAVVALAACRDVPTSVGSGPFTESAFARGGNKGGGGMTIPPGAADLGEFLFKDAALSVNGDESCQTCHDPSEGFAGAALRTTLGSVVQGSEAGQFGNRKPPSAAYATLAPIFTSSGNNATGGNFWDGRATGEVLGNPAADQALGPFLNPKEQGMPDAACVVWRVSGSAYVSSFNTVWTTDLGAIDFPANTESICTTWSPSPVELALSADDREAVNTAYDNIALSIMAYEATLNVFNSRRDFGLLEGAELDGEKLFSTKGKCGQCHDYKGSNPLYTEFEFHNLGVPRNPANPFYGPGEFDPGLGGVGDQNPAHLGKFRTPTLRNVALGNNRTYMHNGALVSLRQVVQFYSTRDVLPTCTDAAVLADPHQWGPDGADCWPPPEYPDNLDTQSMGNLGLTDAEVDALVAFMEALTDVNLPGN